ncbi:MAG: BamA/TamA family outer membrane protein [Shimia sp.]|uniref:BamA/TamA family outer membrane protein n=1 Tax=Shimia sp. TaxID=1954381 RepID=UPI004057E6C5
MTKLGIFTQLLLRITIFASACFGPANTWADTATEALTDHIEVATSGNTFGLSAGSLVVAPVPFRNELVGAGLALGAGYLFKTDELSDTSIIGIGALRTENGSDAKALTASFAFQANTWQTSFFAGEADMYYDLYLGNVSFPVRQTGELYKAKVLYGIAPKVHVGADLRYLDTTLSFARYNPTALTLPLATAELASITAIAKWDTRDDSFSARSGHLLEIEGMFADALNRDNADYRKLVARYTHHRPIGTEHSIAMRFTACTVTDRSPFFDKCSLGGTDNFRGFNPTRFLNSNLLSFQAEYRHQLTSRVSGVGFLGGGLSGPTFERLDNAGIHVAGGFGVRYQLSKDFKAKFSIDVAKNDRGDELLYVYVGQRF